jgi:hypothetical protein
MIEFEKNMANSEGKKEEEAKENYECSFDNGY